MDSEQLFSSARRIQLALQACDIVSALNLADTAAIDTASLQYMDLATGFSPQQEAVAASAGLDCLQSPTYWFDLDTGTQSERKAKQQDCLKTIMQGRSFLNRLSALVESNADPVDLKDDASDIKMRLVDAADRASDPDRIARLIDGVDMIYRACARLAHTSLDGLRVMRIGGIRGRTVVFNGDVEPATAARRIIRAANDIATNSIQGENYSAEEVADSNPFMQSLDDLYRIGALSADDAEDIRTGVLTGTIMVLECGARLYGVDAVGDPVDFSGRRRQHLDRSVDPESADSVDDLEYLALDLQQKPVSDNGEA